MSVGLFGWVHGLASQPEAGLVVLVAAAGAAFGSTVGMLVSRHTQLAEQGVGNQTSHCAVCGATAETESIHTIEVCSSCADHYFTETARR